MAVIRHRGDFQYQVIVRRRGYKQQSKTCISYKEAEAWALMIESEMVRGIFVSRAEAENTTLAELANRYILEICPDHKGKDSEILRLRRMAAHDLGVRFIATLKPLDFAKYRDERLKVRKPATVQRELALVSAVFEVARREWGIHVDNPVSSIRKPTVRNARSRRLDRREEALLMEEFDRENRYPSGALASGVRNPWVKPLVLLALETAMRRGELLSLRWSTLT